MMAEQEVLERFSFENIVGKSPAMDKVFEMVRHLADADTTVLIQGPSGTGKELVAAALHYHGVRSGGPLVKVSSLDPRQHADDFLRGSFKF